jgi:hypothetical protein
VISQTSLAVKWLIALKVIALQAEGSRPQAMGSDHAICLSTRRVWCVDTNPDPGSTSTGPTTPPASAPSALLGFDFVG